MNDRYTLLQFGVKGSFAGISHWEVHGSDPFRFFGTVWRSGRNWWCDRSNRAEGPFKTRHQACKYLVDHFGK